VLLLRPRIHGVKSLVAINNSTPMHSSLNDSPCALRVRPSAQRYGTDVQAIRWQLLRPVINFAVDFKDRALRASCRRFLRLRLW
jgi:hypothetical protein